MTPLIVIWILSLVIPLAILSGKWLSMSGWHVPGVRALSSTTKPLDGVLQQAGEKLSSHAADARHAALLKFHDFIYDDFIPWMQRRYRMIASGVYRLHRRLWSTLEYSRYSSHKVSDYLKQLSHEKEKQSEMAANGKGTKPAAKNPAAPAPAAPVDPDTSA